MTDTNQLPEPELGYIQTDKSNQPAFSARQMREVMEHALQAQVQGEPVAQWQKRHPVRTGGRWISTDEHDAKWWSERATGWEARALYTHPAPSVPADVARDAERWRTFLATRPSNTHEGIIAAIDAAKDSK